MGTDTPTKKQERITTLSGLAKNLGLSPTTVSFVLNGQAKERKISDATVQRVLEYVREVDYVPNALARGLRQKRTHAVGVVFPHLRGDWAHRIMQGIVDVLGESRTVPLIVCHHGSGEHEIELLKSLVERRVDGIICNPIADGFRRYRQVIERGTPMVFLGDSPRNLDEISYVGWDPGAVEIAVKHLIELGHKRIGYLGIKDDRKMARMRQQAFRQTIEEAGLKCRDGDIVLNDAGVEFDHEVDRLISGEDGCTAMFALYDDIAISVLTYLRNKGVRCPEDVSLATIGDAPLVSAPGYEITTVHAPVEDEGRAAAECLNELIKQPKRGAIHRIVPGGYLIRGATTTTVS
ncbi:Ribose operon repressor [Poriferisphaera corsica]|uniref:Ribose operon repressor n=1 Tax=Poriferisphaera corsica TaxID=2528020 RepID=A0A517YTE0_9BACT|nr:LacI family DNA-binding transcriptional regulator [Poriferisphaera corsica]QDU33507.1 Ribose operon repressor [Poriferisphaera corsica]